MLNRLVALTLLVALISSNLSRFFIYAGFQANQKFIATSLCENKSRPWMHCNGRCYLMKKLKQAEEKEKKQERSEQKNRFQEVLPSSAPLLSAAQPTVLLSYPPYSPENPVNRSFSIFHPPQTV
eukprot:gene2794-3216_t